jgi:hypothetical protein
MVSQFKLSGAVKFPELTEKALESMLRVRGTALFPAMGTAGRILILPGAGLASSNDRAALWYGPARSASTLAAGILRDGAVSPGQAAETLARIHQSRARDPAALSRMPAEERATLKLVGRAQAGMAIAALMRKRPLRRQSEEEGDGDGGVVSAELAGLSAPSGPSRRTSASAAAPAAATYDPELMKDPPHRRGARQHFRRAGSPMGMAVKEHIPNAG